MHEKDNNGIMINSGKMYVCGEIIKNRKITNK